MKKAVVYWSGTGNTEAMAKAVAQSASADLFTASEFSAAKANEYDAIAFGCPAMGAEELEESEFDPLFTQIEGKLAGKKVALFGSYGWGDGEWMRTWEERCANDGISLYAESVMCNEMPDADGLAQCKALGAALAD